MTSHDLMEVAISKQGKRATEWARRVRELREDEGMQIRTHIDRADLKPGEYSLESLKREANIGREISARLRMEILERNGFTCQLCGRGAGDPDPITPSRTVRLHIDHIIPHEQGGTNEKDNLRVVCSACNHARANIQAPTETVRNILGRIRRLSRPDRREIYELLKRGFETGSEE